MTGRVGFGPNSDDPRDLARSIDRFGVAYLVIDERRYTHSPVSPLSRYVRVYPERVCQVWSRDEGGTAITIFEVRPVPGNGD